MSARTTPPPVDLRVAAGAGGDNSEDEWRSCTKCWRRLPLKYFRRRLKNQEERASQCMDCHNRARRELAARKRDGRIAKFASTVTDNRVKLRQIVTSFYEIARAFGGIEQFALYWKGAVDRATAAGKHHQAARHLLAMLKIGTVASEAPAGDLASYQFGDLTDEQLDQAMKDQVQDMIRRDPQLAIEAARGLGWIVTPDFDSL